MDALLEEAFLRQYISRRMEEMMAKTAKMCVCVCVFTLL